jgi:hypothetical protein
MNAYIDVESACKAIRTLLDSMEEVPKIERLHNFATIKILCDYIEFNAKNENAWNTSTAEKMRELLSSCTALAGIRPPSSLFSDYSLASTALMSLKNSYLESKERAAETV